MKRFQKRNKKYLETNENGNVTYQKSQDTPRTILKGKFMIDACPQETRKFANKQSNLIPQETRQRRLKPKVSTRKEITKWK